jgi:hypothetical protein
MKQRGDWAVAAGETGLSTQIRGSEKKSATGAWLTLLLPLFIAGFFFGWAHMPLFLKPGVPNPLVGIFGVVVVPLLGWAIWETIRLKRFGDPVLDLTRVPVPLGGTIEGRINLGPGVTTAPPFNLKLQCIHRMLQQGAKNSHWVETVLWTGEKTVALLPGGIVEVSVDVPPDQQETSSDNLSDCMVWRLTVTAPFRGPSFLEKYEIPVEGRTSAAQKIADERERAGVPAVAGRNIFRATLPFLIVGLAIMAGGLYLLWLGVADLATASAGAGWPTASGLVRSSIPPRGNALFVSRSDSDFAYAYDVNGVTYFGHTIYPHLLWRTPAALRMTNRYLPGSMVTVHYAPDDPAKSCLMPGLQAGAFQRLVMALLVLTFGFIFAGAALFAPRDAVLSGNTFTFRQGSMGSKVMGYSFWALVVEGGVLWWVT